MLHPSNKINLVPYPELNPIPVAAKKDCVSAENGSEGKRERERGKWKEIRMVRHRDDPLRDKLIARFA